MDSEQKYLSKRHAAGFVDLSIGKIEAAIRAGELRAFNVGRKILVRKLDLEAWISSREVSRPEQCSHKSELRLLVDRAVEHARKAGSA